MAYYSASLIAVTLALALTCSHNPGSREWAEWLRVAKHKGASEQPP